MIDWTDEAMLPGEILSEVAERYRVCTTYRDSGTVKKEYSDDGTREPRVDCLEFRTGFVRPNRFRFEYRTRRKKKREWSRYIVWRAGAAVRTYWDVTGKDETTDDLGMALAGATGVSGGTAHTVPVLLMPSELSGRRLVDLVDLALLPESTIGERSCYRISARLPTPSPREQRRHDEEVLRITGKPAPSPNRQPTVYWIGKDDLLLRRVETDRQFDTYRVTSVTDYSPATGLALSDAELEFDHGGRWPLNAAAGGR